MDSMSVIMVVAGLALLFLAPKLVGFAVKVVGIALIALGAAIYLGILPLSIEAQFVTIVAALPIIAGLGLIFVAQSMVKMAVRIAGMLLIIAGLSGMGFI